MRALTLTASELAILAMTQADIDRFWSKVDQSGGPDACWPWMAARSNGKYGAFKFRGRQYTAHRIAFELARDPIPNDPDAPMICVCHTCDNQPCCNPAHLFLGTQDDNVADRDAKGRTARGERHGARLHPERVARGERNGSWTHPERRPRGERHGWYTRPDSRPRGDRNGARLHPERVARGERNGLAKLTEEKVRGIRSAVAAGESKVQVGRRFGVSDTVVGRIVRRKTWAHVL